MDSVLRELKEWYLRIGDWRAEALQYRIYSGEYDDAMEIYSDFPSKWREEYRLIESDYLKLSEEDKVSLREKIPVLPQKGLNGWEA